MNAPYKRIPASDTEHAAKVAARWESLLSSGRLEARTHRINEAHDSASEARLFHQAKHSPESRRVLWLHRAADVLGRTIERTKVAACRSGCAHCCHVPVMVSEPEARTLRLAAQQGADQRAEQGGGAAPEMRPHPVVSAAFDVTTTSAESMAQELGVLEQSAALRHTGTPCPFLVESQCSVYAARPMACRLHFSLDDDDLLCQLVDGGAPIRVPYVNVVSRQITTVKVLGIGQRIADIRDWFPLDASAAQPNPRQHVEPEDQITP